MKKFFFSILAVGAMVACTKSEVKFEGETEIAFSPVTSVATKAHKMHAIDGTEYPVNETFRVWGYWQLLDESTDHSAFTSATKYIDNKEFAKANDGTLWRGAEKPYYWPKTGSMVFACISPAEIAASHDVVADNFSLHYESPLSSDETGIDTQKTIDLMWTNTTKSYDENTAVSGVPVTFNHALSWITFKVKGDEVTSAGNFVINSLTMNQVAYKGNFYSKNEDWQLADAKTDVPVFVGNKNLTTEFAVIENVADATLVLPQINNTNDYIATIKFTNNLGDTSIEEVVTINLGEGWKIGKHYTYSITFTATEILIAPEVTDWEETVGGAFEF
jgi:hypothetical protein